MQVTTDFLDIAEYEAKKYKPATLVSRGNSTWVTCDLPVGYKPKKDELTTVWGVVADGEMVRIPLYPYLANSDEPVNALAYAMQLALDAFSCIREQYEIARVHISLGHPVHYHKLNEKEVLRFWLGFGFELEKPDGGRATKEN